MALNRSDKSRILRRYSPGMTRNSEMSTEPRLTLHSGGGNDLLPKPISASRTKGLLGFMEDTNSTQRH